MRNRLQRPLVRGRSPQHDARSLPWGAEAHGQDLESNDDASSINKGFFFVHTALKQWVLSLAEQFKHEIRTHGDGGHRRPLGL